MPTFTFSHQVELKELIAFVVAVSGGAFALWRWSIDQRWRRVQYAYALVKEFLAKPSTIKALQMLDSQRDIELFPEEKSESKRTAWVDESVLMEALATLDEQKTFDDVPFAVRMIFDDFFSDLSMFQHHIDARLIRLEDVKPYLEYWLKALTGQGKVRSSEFSAQAFRFLTYFEYLAVIRLAAASGYEFKVELPTKT